MKKVLLSAVAVLALTLGNAQEKGNGFSKGDVFVSGTLKFNSDSKITNYKQDNFTFAPSLGYFVTENIALGVNLNVGSGSAQATSTSGKDKTSTFGAGLAGRYYFTPASQFSVFAELGASMASVKTTPAGSASSKVNAFGIGFAPGFNYFISKNFSLETKIAVLSYTSAKGDWTGAQSGSSLQFGGDWSAVSFGVNYKF